MHWGQVPNAGDHRADKRRCSPGFDIYQQGKLLGDKKVRGYLSCNTHEIVEFRILQGGNKVNSRSATLDFGKADLSLCLNEPLTKCHRTATLLSLKSQGEWERFLRTGKKQMSLLSSKRVRKRMWGTACQSTSPRSPGIWWINESWKPFPNILKTGRWLGVVSMDLWKEAILDQPDSFLWWVDWLGGQGENCGYCLSKL